MAAMVLMVIVLASFLQVESRLAQSHAGYLRARFNALAAAKMAVGQLQQLAGPDQRVTMRADMYANNDVGVGNTDATTIAPSRPNSGNNFTGNNAPASAKLSHQKRYLTGVWATGGVNSAAVRDWDVTNPNESRLFLGWLASPWDATTATDTELSGAAINYVPNARNDNSSTDPTTYFTKNGGATSSRRKANMGSGNEDISTANYIGQALIDLLAKPIEANPDGVLIPLVSYGTVALPAGLNSFQRNYMGAVDARPQPMPGPAFTSAGMQLGANGRYAFWIGDEGVKAKVNLPDSYGNNTSGASLATTSWDQGFSASTAMRNSIGTIGGPGAQIKEGVNLKGTLPATFNFDSWRNKDITDTGDAALFQLAKTTGLSGLSSWAAKQAGASAGDAMSLATKMLWHDITAYSYSTLTDTYSGGVKTDLSTAFEIPYTMYRGVEVYPGQKESAPFAFTTTSNQHKQSFFHGAPNNTNSGGTDLGLAVDLDYNRPNLLDSLGSANQLLLASPRASEWAPRFTNGSLGTSYSLLKTRNFETPDRMGFVYEAPLRSALFSSTRDLANTERSNSATGTNVTRINSYPWPELSSTAIENISGRITRGPTWDLYRNFYRMYKKEIEAASTASSLANRGQAAPSGDAVIARGVEPLSYATGNRTAPYNAQWINPVSKPPFAPVAPPDNFYSSGGALASGKFFYRNNFTGPADAPLFQAEQRLRYPFILPNKYTAVTNFDRLGIAKPTGTADGSITPTSQQLTTRPWPTAMSLTPSIVRFSMIFSGVYEGQTSSNPGGTIGVTIDPVVVVYNPYDCPIEFEGIAMVTNGQSLPYLFDVKLKNWAFDSSSPQYFTPGAGKFGSEPVPVTTPQTISRTVRVTRDLLLGEVALGDGEYDNRSFSFRVTKGAGQVFRLEPGEVKVLSTPYNVGASYASTRANNTSIRGTEGFDFGSRAVYKMTPFANVRYRQVDVNLQMDTCVPPAQTHDSRMWTWAFTPISPTTNKPYTDASTMPNCKFIGDYCTNYADSGLISWSQLATMWGQVTAARDLHDALPQWDGSAKSLKALLDFYANQGVGSLPNAGVYNSLTFTMRNSGWVNYDGCVVGEEGSSYQGVTNSGAPYLFPRKHTGTTNVGGHQAWNFYLLGNKSIDGQQLNADRRWFGAPDYSNNNSLATFKYEGSETAPGVNLVDEPLLLSFHALTSGWPMYGNDNAHYSNLIVPNEDWKATRGLAARPPDYRVPTGMAGYTDNLAAGTSTSISVLGPLGGDPEYGYIENTGGRANTLGSRVNGIIKTSPGVIGEKQQFFMSDFALRSADMTSDTANKWYPKNQFTRFDGAKSFDALPAGTTWGGIALDTLKTPTEMLNAPMTPFFISVRPQSAHLYAYDGKSHTPIGWVMSQKPLDYGLSTFGNLALSNDHMNAYWGESAAPASSGSRSDVVLFPVPRRPLLSLSQLGSAGTAQVITDADFTVGASFANPGISDLTKITDWPGPKDAVSGSPDDVPVPEHGYVAKVEGTRPIRNFGQVRTDHAFAANLALWDAFFFSGLNMQAPSYSLPAYKSAFPNGPDLPTESTIANQQLVSLRKATGNASLSGTSFSEIKDAMNAGYNPLANKRVAYISDFKAAADTTAFPQPTEFPHPTYLARNSLYNGGFNVNSTSKQAWKAVLAGLKGQNMPTDSGSSNTTGTVLSRFARNFMPASGKNAWNSYRELTDAEIDELAGYVVKEVRDRGPFMSLADFINRRLLSSDHGLKGALQAAIDNSSINNTAIADAGGFFAHPAASAYNDPNGIADGTNYQFRTWDFLLPSKTGSRGAAGSPAPPTPQPRFPSLASMTRNGKYSTAASRASVPQDIAKPDSGGTHASDGGAVAGLGAPQIVSQIDVLNSVGANLTARSDTFTVRAYGEALDNAGNTIGKAWIEVVVQRSPYYVMPSSRGPGLEEANRRKLLYRPKTSAEGIAYDNDPVVEMYESVNSAGTLGGLPSDATADEKSAWKINRLLGRRFKTTNIRWLNANEI
jgi:hypothetical protein